MQASMRRRNFKRIIILGGCSIAATLVYLRVTGLSRSDFLNVVNLAVEDAARIDVSPEVLCLTVEEYDALDWGAEAKLSQFRGASPQAKAVIGRALVPISQFSTIPFRYSRSAGFTYGAENPTKGKVTIQFYSGREADEASVTITLVTSPFLVPSRLDEAPPVLCSLKFHETGRSLYGYCKVPGLEFWEMLGARTP